MDRVVNYTAQHQADWDNQIRPLTYAYNTQVHRSSRTTPFNQALMRQPPHVTPDLKDSWIFQTFTAEVNSAQAKRYYRKKIDYILRTASTRLTERVQGRFRQARKVYSVLQGQRYGLPQPCTGR